MTSHNVGVGICTYAVAVWFVFACWQRRVMMLVAQGSAQRMPESLSRWPMAALQPATTVPGPTNMPKLRNYAYRMRCSLLAK